MLSGHVSTVHLRTKEGQLSSWEFSKIKLLGLAQVYSEHIFAENRDRQMILGPYQLRRLPPRFAQDHTPPHRTPPPHPLAINRQDASPPAGYSSGRIRGRDDRRRPPHRSIGHTFPAAITWPREKQPPTKPLAERRPTKLCVQMPVLEDFEKGSGLVVD